MKLFSRLTEKKVGWRNEAGEFECSGKQCNQKCDETCPLCLLASADFSQKMGMYDDALNELEKAINIAPDYYDAWNVKGYIYGNLSMHQEAYDSFYSAYQLKPDRGPTLVGLAVACKNLNKWDECIRWCNRAALYMDNPTIEEIKKEAKSHIQSSK